MSSRMIIAWHSHDLSPSNHWTNLRSSPREISLSAFCRGSMEHEYTWLSSVHLFIKLQLDYQCARALQRLSLVGQRNILAFMQHSQSDPSLSGALQSLESLSVTCIDYFNPASNLELLEHFLRFLDGSKIRELRVQDERPRKIPFLFWSTCKD